MKPYYPAGSTYLEYRVVLAARLLTLAVYFSLILWGKGAQAQDVTYTPLYTTSTFNNRSVNVSLPVGSLGGTADVTGTGAATYTIPIDLPPGTNGVIPSVSVGYSSHSGNGILGIGWSISGPSYIARTSLNMYFDGQTNPIVYGLDDRFMLDGTRLILKTGSYGATDATYGLETEDFSTITSKGTQGNGPQWFEVVTKDGTKIEYGSSTDSRFIGELSTVLIWGIRKIIYPDGNYITFTYNSSITHELLIDEINYTGNEDASIAPYNKIKFAYKNRTIDASVHYEANRRLDRIKLLDKITVTADGLTTSTYQFNYGHDNINSFLKEVVQSGADGTNLNATIFKYGDSPAELTTVETNGFNNPSSTTLTGDFNADGITDFLRTEEVGSEYQLQIYNKVPDYEAAPDEFYVGNVTNVPLSYSVVKKKEIPNSFQFMAYDFTGDGADDVLMTNIAGSGSSRTLTNLRLNKTVQNYDYPTTGIGLPIEFDPVTINPYTGYSKIHSSGHFLFVGDFNGDGVQDMLTMLGTSGNNYHSHLYFGNVSSAFLTAGTTGTVYFAMADWPTVDKVHIMDFNGDGKSDLMLIKDNHCEIFTFDSFAARRIFYSSTNSHLNKNTIPFFGDFNGDGKTDMLVKNTSTNVWNTLISTGTTFNNFAFNFYINPDTNPYSGDQLAVADFNGDGKADIYHGVQSGSNALFDIYFGQKQDNFSPGATFHRVRSTHAIYLGAPPPMIGDFNGDGRADIANLKSIFDPINLFYIRKDGRENVLEKVKNGVNHTTELVYKKLTSESDYYVRGQLTAFPLNTAQLPMLTVSQLKNQYAPSGFNTIEYSYEGQKLHRTGKGFLGFSKVTAKNLPLGFRTVSENSFNTTYFTAYPYRKSVYTLSNELMNQVTYTSAFVSPASKRFWIKTTDINENNAFENRTTTTANTWDNYGNITASTTTIKGAETTVHTTSTSTTFGAYVTSILNRPTSVTETNTRSGQSVYSVTTTYGYNALGQMTSKTDFSGLPNNIVTTYEYFNHGNLKKTTVTPAGMTGRSTSAAYDATGRFVLSSTNVLTQTSSATFDSRWGKPLTETDVDGITITNEYDPFGRLKKTTFPTSPSYSVNHSLHWDISGLKVWYSHVEHPGKPDVKTWYNIAGLDIWTESEAFPSGWAVKSKGYDSRGLVLYETIQQVKSGETEARYYNYEYDGYNRLTRKYIEDMPLLGETHYAYTYASGNLTTTTTEYQVGSSQVSSKVTDVTGKAISVTDHGGTYTYTYYSHGGIKEVKDGSNIITSSTYDAYGNQTSLIDRNAGTTTYAYNALGQLTSQTNANSQTHTMAYDLAGKITSRTGPELTTTYEYYPSGSGINKLKKVTGFAGNLEEFTYDGFGRVSTLKETVDATAHTTTYEHNIYGDVTSVSYSSGFGTKHAYDANGYPTTIKNSSEAVTIFTNSNMNGIGQPTAYSLGNTKSSTRNYSYGLPTAFVTPGLQNLEMTWNIPLAILTKRKDVIKNKEESFTFDNLHRLTSATITGSSAQSVSYSPTGNISSKTDAGIYTYHSTKVNAVTEVTSPAGTISSLTQDISYTPFMQPHVISETVGSTANELTYTYGADYNRLMGVLKQGSTVVNTRYYLAGYEKNVSGATTRYVHYVNSPAGLVAIVVREGSSETYYYTYTDHLGSIVTVTDNSGNVVAEQNFDAWGRRRNPTSWALLAPTASTGLPVWLYRGYTGHEHLDNFGLINMNGRIYDPVVARMHSPDNYVPDGGFTQDYNRYSYARNNPLMYTDPDGEFIGMVFSTMVFTTFAIQYSLNGKEKPIRSAYKRASDFVYHFGNALQFPIYNKNGTMVTAGINPLSFGISANVSRTQGNVTTSIGGGVGMMSGWFFSANTTYSSGTWDIGIGVGGGNNHFAFGGNIRRNGVGVGYYQTYYGDATGPDDTSNKQTVGGFQFFWRGGSARIENDFLAFQHEDRWRSNALEVSVGSFSIGTRLYNNDPKGENSRVMSVENLLSRFGRTNKSPYTAWEDGKTYNSPFWIGMRVGQNIDRVGFSHKIVHEYTQNFTHKHGFLGVPFVGRQNLYLNYEQFQKGWFGYGGYYNPYSFWGR